MALIGKGRTLKTLLRTTNNNKERIYCDAKGNIYRYA
jgi:hypothetical protein